MPPQQTITFRVQYHEIDRMDTFYNSRALEWFEHGRCDLLRDMKLPYSDIESRGVHLPVIEAHVEYLGRAGFDDLLEMTTTVSLAGRARLRFDMHVRHAADVADGHAKRDVVRGYTIHAITDRGGKPMRMAEWLSAAVSDR